MKITKVIPQVIQIDTDLIKRNDIYNVTDTLDTYGQRNYIVVDVTPKEILLNPLGGVTTITIKAELMDRYVFKKMKLVEDTIDLHTEQNIADNEKEEDFTTQLNKKSMEQMVDNMKKKEKEMTKEECEKAVDDYAEKLLDMLLGNGYDPRHLYKNKRKIQTYL